MFRKSFGAVLAALALVGSSVSAPAQDSGSQSDRSERARVQSRRGESRQDSKARRIRGELVDVRTVQLKGEKERHVLAKIRLGNGRIVVADLGTPRELRQQKARLRKGAKVETSGRQGRINGRQVLVADRVRGDGFDVAIVRVVPQRERGRTTADAARYTRRNDQGEGRQQANRRGDAEERARRSPYRMETGRLVSETTTATVKGLTGERRLIKLRTMDGKTVVAEVGKTEDTKDIRYQAGELLTVIGRQGRINGRPAIIASHVADLVTIDRSEERKARVQMIEKRRAGAARGQNASAQQGRSAQQEQVSPATEQPGTQIETPPTQQQQPQVEDIPTTR